jgi:hypothetical protein
LLTVHIHFHFVFLGESIDHHGGVAADVVLGDSHKVLNPWGPTQLVPIILLLLRHHILLLSLLVLVV